MAHQAGHVTSSVSTAEAVRDEAIPGITGLENLARQVSAIFLNRGAGGVPMGIFQESLSLEQESRFTDPTERRATQLGETAGFLSRFGRGETTDPRFEALRRRRLGTASEFLTRRGIGSSSAALNQLGRVGEQLDIEESGARERALLQSSVFAGQEAALRGNIQSILGQGITSRNLAEQNRLGSITAGVETAALPIQLQISALAAQKAAEGGDDGGGGGGGGGGDGGKDFSIAGAVGNIISSIGSAFG